MNHPWCESDLPREQRLNRRCPCRLKTPPSVDDLICDACVSKHRRAAAEQSSNKWGRRLKVGRAAVLGGAAMVLTAGVAAPVGAPAAGGEGGGGGRQLTTSPVTHRLSSSTMQER